MAATITKTKNATPVGEYHPTEIDGEKSAADILVIGHGRGEKSEISTKLKLSGAGIKQLRVIGNRATYLVSEDVMTELRRRYCVRTDF